MIIFVGALLIAVFIYFILKKRSGTLKHPVQRKVQVSYKDENVSFEAIGNTDDFIIKKDNRFEFLVKDGLIVACKDLYRHEGFIYYREE